MIADDLNFLMMPVAFKLEVSSAQEMGKTEKWEFFSSLNISVKVDGILMNFVLYDRKFPEASTIHLLSQSDPHKTQNIEI